MEDHDLSLDICMKYQDLAPGSYMKDQGLTADIIMKDQDLALRTEQKDYDLAYSIYLLSCEVFGT